MIGRRDFVKAGMAAACAPASAWLDRTNTVADRPHILLLMADQHRGDWIDVEGTVPVLTPNLGRLAGGGVRFSNAYSSTPTCTPARAALLTGMSPWNHGLLGYGVVAERYPVEMPRLLREAGYYTAGIGKMHWHPQRTAHGFNTLLLDESGRAESPEFRSDYRSWFWSEAPDEDPDATGLNWNGYEARPYALPERLHPTTWTGDTAVRFLREYKRPEPFFLKVSFSRPHSPYDPPRRWMDRYDGVDIPPAAEGAWADAYRERSDNGRAPWHGEFGPAQVRSSRQGYCGSVSFVDEQIGRMLATLRDRGWFDNTLVIYLSDHGDMLGDHHLWRKSYAYQGSARIPMIVHWPAGWTGARGRVLPNPVEIRDVLPTLLDAAGAAIPPQVDGRSLLTLARDPAAPWRPWIDLEHDVTYDAENHWNALTDGKRKFIFHAMTGREQLFDLEHDPQEVVDRAGDPEWSNELRAWRDRMTAHLAPRGAPWVVDGKLGLRTSRQLHSPNYPR
ncbi:MAG: arylsulfatase [Gemmatimonadaceae bacterium]